MIKYPIIALVFCLSLVRAYAQNDDIIKYVNPLTGTANSTTVSAIKHSTGSYTEALANVIPAVGVPFGMTQFTPQTRLTEKKCVAPYYYKDPKINGFRATHWLSGSCTQDYGSLSIMPISGDLKTSAVDYASSYQHQNEQSSPNYYKVLLDDYQITTEITALARSGMMRFTAGNNKDFYLLISPNSDKDKGFVHIDNEKGEVTGYNPAYRIYQGSGNPAGFSGYFVIQFEKKSKNSGVYYGNQILHDQNISDKKDLGAFLKFDLKKGEQLTIKIGSSFSSIANARKNLDGEIKHWDFDKVRQQAAEIWNKALGQIKVETPIEKYKDVFYTAFYHSMQVPRLFNDADGTYPKYAHQYENAIIKESDYYDDFSMWDTYRAQLPLFQILQPRKLGAFANSIVLKGQQGGWLPIFPCWNNYTGAMIGDHGSAFLASTIVKHIKGFDENEAYLLMRKNAFETPDSAAYKDGKGRRALTDYIKYGYIPLENHVLDAFHTNEQVSRTLEYAFDDYGVAKVAEKLGKADDAKLLFGRAKNYQHVFDKNVQSVNGRYADGTFSKGFNPDKKLPFITEGTPRQYLFYVPQDVKGLANQFGGAKGLEKQLDSLFDKNEYWHGNEPGHQIPFMYNYTDAAWKTQKVVRQILEEEYTNGIGGLSGNDDAGQMSAWYVFASLGFYPVNPVSNEYMISSPLFTNAVITLENGKKVEIKTNGNSAKGKYIQSLKLNGKPYHKAYFTYQQLMDGAKIEFELDEKPNSNW
ncbi:Alpha-1,2-mannosidase [Arcticibacter svalbardensis MN12-7]|uniref:Alpha-1,2-mannosidase n=1 Tax=Arcticibacter svalbardensis MN12-7 TaxID=1150600 RepID=R9GU81_9SPHI|nr:GH92 family glycosyl hydrolase [Arcticibacter svalbardensis]EOR95271.1 Alpha-1,2-mannosidase [Arcticibacter svalbardensis MN12-7]